MSCWHTTSLHDTVNENNSGEASLGTLMVTCHPGWVPRLIVEYVAETIWQVQVFRSLAIAALQLFAAEEASISAANCRFAALSKATMAGVANLGRHMAALLMVAACVGQLKAIPSQKSSRFEWRQQAGRDVFTAANQGYVVR
jgi:hypothetical protein